MDWATHLRCDPLSTAKKKGKENIYVTGSQDWALTGTFRFQGLVFIKCHRIGSHH